MFGVPCSVLKSALRGRSGWNPPLWGERRRICSRVWRDGFHAVRGFIGMSLRVTTAGIMLFYTTRTANAEAWRFVSMPDTYEPEVSEPYDQSEMNRMFEIGYEMGLAGDAWRAIPPGY